MLRRQVEKLVLRELELRIHALTWQAKHLKRLLCVLMAQQQGLHLVKHDLSRWRVELLHRVGEEEEL